MIRIIQQTFLKIANKINRRLNQNWNLLTRNEFRYFDIHFSQYGEDIFINEKLKNVEKGTYCDVGAFDPIWFSNTHLLFKRGWSGINLDLDDTKIKKFQKERPKDVSLALGVGDRNQKAWALEYELTVLNRLSFDPDRDFLSANGDKPIAKHEIQIQTLDSILEKYLQTTKLDFLNIDCEGYEENILKGTALKKWNPKLIAIEYLNNAKLEKLKTNLFKEKYQICGQIGITAFFEAK